MKISGKLTKEQSRLLTVPLCIFGEMDVFLAVITLWQQCGFCHDCLFDPQLKQCCFLFSTCLFNEHGVKVYVFERVPDKLTRQELTPLMKNKCKSLQIM